MLGRIKKGENVIGMRAISIRGKAFNKGPVLIRGSYVGKMRDWYMVQTKSGKVYLCSDIRKGD